jgi:MFS family permease
MQEAATIDFAVKADVLTKRHWIVLAVTMTLWMFDGYETYALLLTLGPSLQELLPVAQKADLPHYAALLISITLFGWAVGGILGGLAGDRLGRRRTMIGSVIVYSIFTGFSGLSSTWEWLALTRFLTGVGLGAEWGVGTALLQETWPDRWRTKGAGVMQSAFSFGFLVASLVWIVLGGSLGLSWRWMYVLGIVPALLVVSIGHLIPESKRWTNVDHSPRKIGSLLSVWRRPLIVAVVVSVSITVGFWAISSWVPTYVASLAPDPRTGIYYAGWAGALFALGEVFGCIGFGLLAEWWGRRITLAVYLVGSVAITPIIFILVKDPVAIVWLQLLNGYVTGGLYGWYSIHPPELFPTAIRSSAVSIIFNAARLLAMFGPIVASNLISYFGGYGPTTTILSSVFLVGAVAVFFLPETRGRHLPD